MDVNWDAVSAVSTTLAVIVALGFSLQPILGKRREAKDTSELAAAKMLSHLSILEHWASSIHAVLLFNRGNYDQSNPELRKLMEEIRTFSAVISLEDFYPLLSLPYHAAKRSARALGLVETFVIRVSGFLDSEVWESLDDRGKAAMYSSWADEAREFRDLLLIAVRVCQSVAFVAVPKPSDLEIHGRSQQ